MGVVMGRCGEARGVWLDTGSILYTETDQSDIPMPSLLYNVMVSLNFDPLCY